MILNVLTLHNVVSKQLHLSVIFCRCLMSHLTVTSLLWACIFSFFNNALIASCITWVISLTVLMTEFYLISSVNRTLIRVSWLCQGCLLSMPSLISNQGRSYIYAISHSGEWAVFSLLSRLIQVQIIID